jgi:hypothetical protein
LYRAPARLYFFTPVAYTGGMYGKHHGKIVKIASYALAVVVIASMVLAYFASTF